MVFVYEGNGCLCQLQIYDLVFVGFQGKVGVGVLYLFVDGCFFGVFNCGDDN